MNVLRGKSTVFVTLRRLLVCGLFAATAASAGCDDEHDHSDAVRVSGSVGEFSPGNGLVGLADATVCVYDRRDLACTSTDSEGAYVLDHVPADSEVLLEFTKDAFVPQIGPITTAKADIGPVDIRLAANSLAEIFFGILGGEFPLGATGGVTFGTYDMEQGGGLEPDSGAPGYVVTYAPESGTDVTYVSDGEIPEAGLTETQLPGWGAFTNVTAGEVTVTFDRADGSCPTVRNGYGWASRQDGTSLTVPIIAGYLTSAALLCRR
ncbi:MAG: hypothetical protein ACI9MR_000731 [Myxococcota bacterium]|jgi:hypothetical protein